MAIIRTDLPKALTLLAFLSVTVFHTSLADSKPKYGPLESPRAIPLSKSNEYFRNPAHPAPDFWALISHYVPQYNGAACSVASLSMVLNAARATLERSASDKNITQEELLNRVNIEHWKERMSKLGHFGRHGVSLDQFGKIAEAAFKLYGFPNASTRTIHINDALDSTKVALRKILQEKKPTDFIVANFDQKLFTDDTQAGHLSPVGAYDSKKDKVLILDTDREYYEPYWVSVDDFVLGMSTLDGSEHRGYVYIQTTPRK